MKNENLERLRKILLKDEKNMKTIKLLRKDNENLERIKNLLPVFKKFIFFLLPLHNNFKKLLKLKTK